MEKKEGFFKIEEKN